MGCTLAEAQQRITSREFCQWKAFAELCPIDPMREEQRWAQLMCLVQARTRGKSEQATSPSDWSPYLRDTNKITQARHGGQAVFNEIVTQLRTAAAGQKARD